MREMKDSGVEWIGEIPKEWHITQTRRLFRNEKNIVGDAVDEYERLALTLKGVIKRSKNDSEGLQPEKFEGYQILRQNELVFKMIDLENVNTSRVGLSPYTGLVSPAYIVLKNDSDDNRYEYYWFMSMYYNEVFNHLGGDGVRSALNVKDMLSLPIPNISKVQKKMLADYLDAKCSKIDDIIEKQQAIIEKLKIQKQTLITETVRHGIKENKKKQTRYFWVGCIPEHWQVGQLKFFAKIRAGITLGKKYSADEELVELPYLRVANVQGEYVDLTDVATIRVKPDEVDKYKLHIGELLMTEGGDRDKLGRGCVWKGELEVCLHQNHVFAVTTDENKLDVFYLDYVTTSDIARNYFDYTAKKTTNLASTNSTAIMQFRLPIPPIDEQKEIVRYLDKKVTETNIIIGKKEKIIGKLQEYKKSLIYEVVTGKKEV